MAEIGYSLSSEEHGPRDLVRNAAMAEDHGFPFALISDHYFPWTERQGHASFVWSVLGAIAEATSRLRIGTGVTCPTIRYHPALLAQSTATVAGLMPGRFFFGVGTGENLNEHIYGDRWPAYETRRAMLEEAIGVIRDLWRGELYSHRGEFFTVENARIWDVPERLPEIVVAATGPESIDLGARIGDGLMSTAPKRELVDAFRAGGGSGKPAYAQVTVCWGPDERQARRTALEWWPTVAIHGDASQELPLPRHFEELTKDATEEQVAGMIACGPDAEVHVAAIRKYVDAGFDHVFVHQVGPDQAGMLEFYARDVLPRFA